MSGGAAGKKPAEDAAGTKSIRPNSLVALKIAWCDLMRVLNPDKWERPIDEVEITLEEMKQQIREAAGLELAHSIWTTCSDDTKQRLRDFREKHGFGDEVSDTAVFMFHGTSCEAALNICTDGMNLDLYQCGRYGKGGYVTQEIQYAIPYCKSSRLPCGKRLFSVVFGLAEFGMPAEKAPVGSKDQEDFGRSDDGREICVSRNKAANYWCLKYAQQFTPLGFLVFSMNTKTLPSDFALRHMIYPEDVWAEMKENIPGLVERKEMLKASFNAGGSRQQPPRASKAPGASKASRYTPY
jgi:hypothetical protein